MPNPKIKLTQIITALGYGGAERMVFDLARSLDKDRFDVSIITVVGGGPYETKFKQIGVPVYVNQKKGRLGLGVIKQIKAQLEELKPDIVQTHLFAADVWGGLAAQKAGVPVIISTAQNTDLDEGWLKKTVKRHVASKFDKVVAISGGVKQYLIKAEKVSPDRIEVIYSGVEVNKFLDPAPQLFKRKAPVLGIVARLTEQKGYPVLLDALAAMKNNNAILKIVGEGPLEDFLRQKVKTLGLSGRVEFLGRRDDVENFFKEIDIFVMPSLWEGLGLVLIEAALSGRPIVSTNVGGIPEVVKDKETGFLVPPGNHMSLAASLDWLIDNKIAAAEMGLKGQLYSRKFDLETMASAYASLYERLLA